MESMKQRMREARKEFRELGGKFEFDKGNKDAIWVVYDGVRIGYSFIYSDWFCDKLHAVVMCFLCLQDHFDLVKEKEGL